MSRPRLGLRREILILLPASLLLSVVLATFTLFAYRNAILGLADERRQEAAQRAAAAAAQLATLPAPGEGELRGAVGEALGAALVDLRSPSGPRLGDLPPGPLLAPLEGAGADGPIGLGPDDGLGDRVVGFAPLPGGRFLRLDLDARALAAQLRSLRPLFAVVLGVEAALLLLMILFLRHLLAPYESLLARARQWEGNESEKDEVEFLLATFDRALEALARPAPTGAEEEIAALERTLAPSLEGGLLLLDRRGAVLSLNAAGADLLGLDPPRQGAPLSEALAPLPDLVHRLDAAVAEERRFDREELHLGEMVLGLAFHPLRRDDGGVRGFLVLLADLTERQRADEESRLAESLAELGELAAGIAHELRNSLATLRGYLGLIERRPEEESVRDYLGEIRHETDHLQRVLEDFLTFARPGSARPEEVDLAALVHRAAADPALAGAAIRVRIEGEATGAPFSGDPQLLERAVRNLLHNAVEAERRAGLEPAPQVTIHPPGESWRLEIADRGPGIPPELRQRLFRPFSTGRSDGVGLGLALTHRIVTLHGGRIQLLERETGGTQARISLPPGRTDTESNKSGSPPA